MKPLTQIELAICRQTGISQIAYAASKKRRHLESGTLESPVPDTRPNGLPTNYAADYDPKSVREAHETPAEHGDPLRIMAPKARVIFPFRETVVDQD